MMKPLPENGPFRLLGLPFDSSLSWCQYIEDIAKAASKKMGSLYQARKSANINIWTPCDLKTLIKTV